MPKQRREAPAEDVKEPLRREGEQLFTPREPGAAGAPGPRAVGDARGGWSIVIASYRDEQRDAMAQRALERVRTIGGLPEAYAEVRGPVAVVAYGDFADPTSPEAQAALRRVRTMEVEVEGRVERPFSAALLVPPAGFAGSVPEYDLRRARSQHGEWALYTLQVAFYGRVDRTPPTAAEMDAARAAAEEAVLRLRREGEQAFYYHGPRGSTVTLGLFGDEDYRAGGDGRLEFESPTLTQLRRRHPNNLVNGAGVRERVQVIGPDGRPTRTDVMQPSRLVAVPRD